MTMAQDVESSVESHDTFIVAERDRDEDGRKLAFLTKLSALDVKVTEYLIGQQDPPPARQIRMTAV